MLFVNVRISGLLHQPLGTVHPRATESSVRILFPGANDETHYTENMSESAGRYVEGTIPDWLIRGLDGLGGWSIAKLIRVVLPYLYVPRQMTSVLLG